MPDNNGLAPHTAGMTTVTLHGQAVRKTLLACAIILGSGFLLIGDSRWPGGHWLHETIEWFGIVMIVTCIMGRTWSSLYIGGQKNLALITYGPYSIVRNPLYLFSIIGAAGVGAQVGSIAAALIAGFIAWAIHLWTVSREEAALAAIFGTSYLRYCEEVPRLWPRLSRWRDLDTIEVRPRVVLATFADALIFLVAVPLAEGLEYLHEIGFLPNLLLLP